MYHLLLEHGPKLSLISAQSGESTDITQQATAYLTSPVTIAEGLIVADIFKLIAKNPAMHPVFEHQCVEEFLAHAIGLNYRSEQSSRTFALRYEGAVLVPHWTHDKESNELTAATFSLACDVANREREGSSRVSASPVGLERLLSLPLRLELTASVREAAEYSTQFDTEKLTVRIPPPTLIQILSVILGDLCKGGSPSEKKAEREQIQEILAVFDYIEAEEDAGRPLAPATRRRDLEDFPEVRVEDDSIAPVQFVMRAFLNHYLASVPEAYAQLKACPDDEIAQEWFNRQIPSGLYLNPQYAELPGIVLRRELGVR